MTLTTANTEGDGGYRADNEHGEDEEEPGEDPFAAEKSYMYDDIIQNSDTTANQDTGFYKNVYEAYMAHSESDSSESEAHVHIVNLTFLGWNGFYFTLIRGFFFLVW